MARIRIRLSFPLRAVSKLLNLEVGKRRYLGQHAGFPGLRNPIQVCRITAACDFHHIGQTGRRRYME